MVCAVVIGGTIKIGVILGQVGVIKREREDFIPISRGYDREREYRAADKMIAEVSFPKFAESLMSTSLGIGELHLGLSHNEGRKIAAKRIKVDATPSLKVRKEKLGDQIAALQQLLSPFGKTDTAAVLMEAIGYIKFLENQVQTHCAPYMKSSREGNVGATSRGLQPPRGLCLAFNMHVARHRRRDGTGRWWRILADCTLLG